MNNLMFSYLQRTTYILYISTNIEWVNYSPCIKYLIASNMSLLYQSKIWFTKSHKKRMIKLLLQIKEHLQDRFPWPRSLCHISVPPVPHRSWSCPVAPHTPGQKTLPPQTPCFSAGLSPCLLLVQMLERNTHSHRYNTISLVTEKKVITLFRDMLTIFAILSGLVFVFGGIICGGHPSIL